MTETFDFEPSEERLRQKHATKWRHVPDDVLPAWVAETDFDLCPAIAEAIASVVDRGDLGYPDWTHEPLAVPFAERMAGRYGWHLDPGLVRRTCDLVQAMQVVTELCTNQGDAVALHAPNYPPFLRALEAMGRRPVYSPMEPVGETWGFDVERLDRAIAGARAKLLLLVNPHNPTGRVLTRPELESIADIASRYDLVVLSDELHAELSFDGHDHIPFASLGDDAAGRTVTITSATKSFNLGGMRAAVAHVGDERVRAAWDRLPSEMLGSQNVLGVEATLAAWRHGDDWLERQRTHLQAQRDHLVARLADVPGIELRSPDATYLAWLDCRAATLEGGAAEYFRSRARVELSPGPIFGPGGDGHARLNFGTGRKILDEIVDRIAQSLSAH